MGSLVILCLRFVSAVPIYGQALRPIEIDPDSVDYSNCISNSDTDRVVFDLTVPNELQYGEYLDISMEVEFIDDRFARRTVNVNGDRNTAVLYLRKALSDDEFSEYRVNADQIIPNRYGFKLVASFEMEKEPTKHYPFYNSTSERITLQRPIIIRNAPGGGRYNGYVEILLCDNSDSLLSPIRSDTFSVYIDHEYYPTRPLKVSVPTKAVPICNNGKLRFLLDRESAQDTVLRVRSRYVVGVTEGPPRGFHCYTGMDFWTSTLVGGPISLSDDGSIWASQFLEITIFETPNPPGHFWDACGGYMTKTLWKDTIFVSYSQKQEDSIRQVICGDN